MSDENTTQPIARINGKWAPGQSGNPAGRTRDEKLREVRELALDACPDAIKGLIEIAADKKERAAVRVAAMTEILNRGLGKALLPVAATVENVPDGDELSEMEFARRIAFILDRGLRAAKELGVVSSVPILTVESSGDGLG